MNAANSDVEAPSLFRGIIIEIPIKSRKKPVSLRIDEDALSIIDKYTTIKGDYSRTLLMTKVIEALARGLKETGFNATKLEMRFIYEENGEEKSINIVIPLASRRKA